MCGPNLDDKVHNWKSVLGHCTNCLTYNVHPIESGTDSLDKKINFHAYEYVTKCADSTEY